MPVIMIEGPPIPEISKKREFVANLTRAAADAYGMPKEKIIVLIRENRPDQVAVGGELIADRR